ncbi:MAG: L-lysine 6-transaminase [Candidatus Fermentibacteraceae bacterium]|nr:L-lysine 6-transaminase [Candidatus Fermentibacteraceae bacterium]MBN2607528.1 L-lysine 6-transaminase [Candidatus Fermentibacteraceae bacterium]
MKHMPASEVRPTIARHMLADGFDMVLDLRKSRGSIIHDALQDRDYLDLFSFFASAPLGMNHPALCTDEFRTLLADAAINKPSNSDFYTEEMADFVRTFADTTIPDSHPYLFFVSGGALAVENALKAAFDWKVRENMKAGRGETGSSVIHFRNAFHGRSGYTLSMTNTADPRKYMYFPKFDWPRVDSPSIVFPLNEHLDEVEKAEKQSLEQIDRTIDQHGHDIACLVIEPIQAEGGDNHFRPEFLQQLRLRADKHQFLLIFDEIQSGMGLTGEWWAWQTLGVEPDIFCFGKKAQVCGIASNRRIDSVEENVFHESSRINSTWGGNLVDMVRCTKYLQIMVEENTLENVRARSITLMEGLEDLQERNPGRIGNVRGRGLMCAFDLPDTMTRNMMLSEIMKNGAIILPCGTRSIRFRPPLNITDDELVKGLDMISRAADTVLRD